MLMSESSQSSDQVLYFERNLRWSLEDILDSLCGYDWRMTTGTQYDVKAL